MKCRERAKIYLEMNDVEYQSHQHPEVFTAQEVAEIEHVPGQLVAKVVVVFADDEMVMLALPADHKVNLKDLAEAVGARDVRLAYEDEFADRFSDCEIGAMPPFGAMYDIPVFVDSSLTEDDTIYVQAGTHTETLSLSYSDYERLEKPKVCAFARHL
ncbi:MAG: YbaK/EbsC family protein [SAR202 cluster bacterium]|jgi:Ala-tRNA(Pro) deacylase|nr:YbaK/EbsC family protein [SAR202 cluster bacterium]MDP6511895.1 YbaK/EbsC family protein [SAR202 cluster bacterium]MDP6713508.1 YbaK/EbsC family protein [SAR202 cluster bacterium]